MKDIEFHFHKAESIALALLEQRARKILSRHTNLSEFVMCMGSAFFVNRHGEIIHLSDAPKYCNPVIAILDEWDRYLHLTGTSMRFTATGSVVTEW